MIDPCRRHHEALTGRHALPWHRALQVAQDCPNCTIVPER